LAHREQHLIDREDPAHGRAGGEVGLAPREPHPGGARPQRVTGERAARDSLRAQIARLERELSAIVSESFPFIPVPAREPQAAGGPSLLGLEALECTRDRLAGRLQRLRAQARERAEQERLARALLQRMRLEPGRYRFARLPVSELGQGGCGVWQVRPRLGLIGMLAGWWQLTLS
jgi:hypothetical protein